MRVRQTFNHFDSSLATPVKADSSEYSYLGQISKGCFRFLSIVTYRFDPQRVGMFSER